MDVRVRSEWPQTYQCDVLETEVRPRDLVCADELHVIGGARVWYTAQVIPRSPAADAGLRFGDVLTSLDGQLLTSSPQLQTVISEAEVNQVVRLRVRRSGSEKVRTASMVCAGVSAAGVSRAED